MNFGVNHTTEDGGPHTHEYRTTTVHDRHWRKRFRFTKRIGYINTSEVRFRFFEPSTVSAVGAFSFRRKIHDVPPLWIITLFAMKAEISAKRNLVHLRPNLTREIPSRVNPDSERPNILAASGPETRMRFPASPAFAISLMFFITRRESPYPALSLRAFFGSLKSRPSPIRDVSLPRLPAKKGGNDSTTL